MEEYPSSSGSGRRGLAGSLAHAAPFVLLAASLSLNVALGWKLKAASLREAKVRTPGIQERSTLPESIPVIDLEGKRASLSLRDPRPTLIYVLSPACQWCDRNSANIRALAAARASDYRFVGLAIRGDALGEYVAKSTPGFPVFAVDSDRLAGELGLGVTPQTILLTSKGTVEKVWNGAFGPAAQADLERFFGVTLPGLTEPTHAPVASLQK